MKKFLIALAILILPVFAVAQSIFTNIYPLSYFQPGFRAINGQQLNRIVAEVNAMTGFPSNVAGLHGITGTTGNFTGHYITGAVPPVLTACGTTPAISGSDTAGLVTMGTTATGCVITFAIAYVTAPYCVVSWQATPLASQSYTISTTAITTVQTSTSNNLLNYHCIAQSGG